VLSHAAAALRSLGCEPPGIAITVAGDLPIGAGLASSAAWIVAATAALAELAGARPVGATLARLGPVIERAATGVPCGAMDPLAVLGGRTGCALAIDSATGATRPAPLPAGLAIALIDTGTRRQLDDGRYAARRRESEAAALALGVADLRAASLDDCSRLPAPLAARARHVVAEIARVRAAVAALRAAELPRFGVLLGESHASLRDLYEVSSPALDAAVELAAEHPACFGARLTGAGFAGCAIAAVAAADAERFAAELAPRLHARLGPLASAAIVAPADGAALLLPERRRLADR
jgi:galactokinase